MYFVTLIFALSLSVQGTTEVAGPCESNCSQFCEHTPDAKPTCLADCMSQFCEIPDYNSEQPSQNWPASQNLDADVEAHRAHNVHETPQQKDNPTPAKQPNGFSVLLLQIGCLSIIGTGIYFAWMYLSKKGLFAPLSGKELIQELTSYKQI